MRRLIASLLALAFATPAAAASKSYFAERFDSTIRVLDAGAIEVTETVVFRFEGGPFKEVFRELPRRRTDAIEIVRVEMDGRPLEFGKDAGQVEIREGNKLRVVWRFAPRADSTNTFLLTYIARGVVERQADADVLAWNVLPTEHNYRIDRSEIVFELPTPPRDRATVATRRVGNLTDTTIEPGGQRVQLAASNIGKNGYVTARIPFDGGALMTTPPAWQLRQITARDMAPRWMTAAAVIFVAGLMFLLALYQRYDSPGDVGGSSGPLPAAPDAMRAGIAGALAANGRVGISQAMATVFALADRGLVTIAEEPRRWGQRHFALHRAADSRHAGPEEIEVLTLAFRNKDREESSVPLDKARNRVASGIRAFKAAVYRELRALGMLDEDRMRVRARVLAVSVALLIVAGLLVIPAAVASSTYLGWPFLIPAAVAAVAIIGLIMHGSLTPLSNEGVRSAERWRGYQRHLKDVARDRAQLVVDSPPRVLPFAVALGLTGLWSRYMKRHATGIPPWFQALGVSDQEGFPAFLAVVGHGADGGGGGGAGAAGGAGGGGGSGAS